MQRGLSSKTAPAIRSRRSGPVPGTFLVADRALTVSRRQRSGRATMARGPDVALVRPGRVISGRGLVGALVVPLRELPGSGLARFHDCFGVDLTVGGVDDNRQAGYRMRILASDVDLVATLELLRDPEEPRVRARRIAVGLDLLRDAVGHQTPLADLFGATARHLDRLTGVVAGEYAARASVRERAILHAAFGALDDRQLDLALVLRRRLEPVGVASGPRHCRVGRSDRDGWQGHHETRHCRLPSHCRTPIVGWLRSEATRPEPERTTPRSSRRSRRSTAPSTSASTPPGSRRGRSRRSAHAPCPWVRAWS